ncbi:MAG: hypothetical protein IJ315_06705 [Firmicutes bacterium]|nr:hypothetical protein [Bacillota bacterium]
MKVEEIPVKENKNWEERNTFKIVSQVGYLLGVPQYIFEREGEPLQIERYNRLEKNKNARLVRNLCILRTVMMKKYKSIQDKMKFEYKTLQSIEEIPQDILQMLREDGIEILKSKSTIDDYLFNINQLISDRINNCRDIFPLWLNWSYVRSLFIMPNGTKENGIKEAMDLFYEQREVYPYALYLNWKPRDAGNILYNDKKFVTLLYGWNNDSFKDFSKVSDVGNTTKKSIYDFLDDSERTVVVVDCENSDPYKLCATLSDFKQDAIKKIKKIMLFNDVHAASGWNMLEDYTIVPVEHLMVERIKENKSLVDIRLTAGTCKEFYQNEVDSFIIVSSDSDYWGLISSLPEARFLVMIEREKCGPDMKTAMINSGIFYCYIDDFYSGDTDIKMNALVREIYRYLKDAIHLNVNEMLDKAFFSTRIVMSEAEKSQFYNRYIKPMHLIIEKEGNVKIQLQSK